MPDLTYDAFISYSHHDRAWVHDWLLPRLEAANLRVCIDVESFDIGVPALINKERAVADSRHTLIILTPAWLASEWTEFEGLLTQTADPVGRRQRLLPILLADCTPPARIAMLTYADFRVEAAREAQLARVIAAIQGQLNLRALGPALRELLPPVPALHTLRAPVADFTGRTADLAALVAHLNHDNATATISGIRGMGGIGKTELALAVAHALRDRCPDAQLMFELQPGNVPLTAAALLAAIIYTFQPDQRLPDALPDLQTLYRAALADKQGLLLLDNAAEPEQVRPLLPPTPGWTVIVTSRARFPLPGALLHDLELLPLPDAVALLHRLLSDGGRHDLIPTPAPAAASSAYIVLQHPLPSVALAERCGRLPLALHLAAGFLTTYPWTLPDYLAALDRAPLDRLVAPGMPSVQAVLGFSIAHLRNTAPALFARWQQLAVFPAPFDRAAAAAVWGALADPPADDLDAGPTLTLLDPDATLLALSALFQQSLVDCDRTRETYTLHDLLVECILADPSILSDAERSCGTAPRPPRSPALFAAAHLRHAWHYLAAGRAADDLYLQGGDHVVEGLQSFRVLWPHLLAAWRHLHDRTDPAALRWINAFPTATINVLALHLTPREIIPLHSSALAAARSIGDRAGEGSHLGNLGNAYADLGDLPRAIEHYEAALAIDRAICAASTERSAEWTAARRGEGVWLGDLGIAYDLLGDLPRAISSYEAALAISLEIGDRAGEANALGNRGIVYARLGDLPRAIASYEAALTISSAIGDRRGEGVWLGNLGVAYADQGDLPRAIASYDAALTISSAIGDRAGEADTLANLGIAYESQGDAAKARAHWQQALAIYEAIGSPRAAAGRAWRAETPLP